MSLRKEGESFVFYEGPPSSNGLPGIHHVMARTIKDVFCRFKTLQGYYVNRKAGWDTHGLPVEYEIDRPPGHLTPMSQEVTRKRYSMDPKKLKM